MPYTASSGLIQFVETFASFISLCSSLYCGSQLQKEKNGQYSLTDSMLIVLLIVDVVLSIFFGIGVAGSLNKNFCKFQVNIYFY